MPNYKKKLKNNISNKWDRLKDVKLTEEQAAVLNEQTKNSGIRYVLVKETKSKAENNEPDKGKANNK